ncbi:MAG TPA: DUF2905 domain-containing protein [Terracidiphilus sp.]|jgi:hypothetical protein|nr:DUF2905 domain-containing protein [Terracidiphilus sp.]
MSEIGKALIGIGVLCVLAGAGILVAARMGLPLGRLPGDLSYRGKNFTVFAPLGTSILVSVLLSALLYFISRFRR